MKELSEARPLRVIVADTHELSRKGLRQVLEEAHIKVVCQCRSPEEALHMAQRTEPDVVLMGAGMPERCGVETAEMITDSMPEVKIAMITTSRSGRDMLTAFKAGVTGHLLVDTSVEDLVKSLELVAVGGVVFSPMLADELQTALETADATEQQESLAEVPITEREQEVLACIARGMTNKEIGESLFITEHTVKVHVKNILDKLGLRNKQHAAAWAVVHGLADADDVHLPLDD